MDFWAVIQNNHNMRAAVPQLKNRDFYFLEAKGWEVRLVGYCKERNLLKNRDIYQRFGSEDKINREGDRGRYNKF